MSTIPPATMPTIWTGSTLRRTTVETSRARRIVAARSQCARKRLIPPRSRRYSGFGFVEGPLHLAGEACRVSDSAASRHESALEDRREEPVLHRHHVGEQLIGSDQHR